jgi:hypothetical protein
MEDAQPGFVHSFYRLLLAPIRHFCVTHCNLNLMSKGEFLSGESLIFQKQCFHKRWEINDMHKPASPAQAAIASVSHDG